MLLAPAGFEFPKGDFDACATRLHLYGLVVASKASSLLERRGREPWDFEGLFSGSDVLCRVGDEQGVPSAEGGEAEGRTMVLLLINRKAIFQGEAYTLEGRVRNPMQPTWPRADSWLLESFQRALDDVWPVRMRYG